MFRKKFIYTGLLFLLALFIQYSYCKTLPTHHKTTNDNSEHTIYSRVWHKFSTLKKFYVGTALGYGSTDWSYLVCSDTSNNCDTISLSSPTAATDSGFTWGFYVGWQMMPNFFLELQYTHFPKSKITFANGNIYINPDVMNNGFTMTSDTDAYALIGKFAIPIMHSRTKAFASAGLSFTHRKDILANKVQLAPDFGVGLMRDIGQRVIMQLAFQYYVGYGVAKLRPANDYIPFLYSITLNLGIRI